jgi:hypothetical protein
VSVLSLRGCRLCVSEYKARVSNRVTDRARSYSLQVCLCISSRIVWATAHRCQFIGEHSHLNGELVREGERNINHYDMIELQPTSAKSLRVFVCLGAAFDHRPTRLLYPIIDVGLHLFTYLAIWAPLPFWGSYAIPGGSSSRRPKIKLPGCRLYSRNNRTVL